MGVLISSQPPKAAADGSPRREPWVQSAKVRAPIGATESSRDSFARVAGSGKFRAPYPWLTPWANVFPPLRGVDRQGSNFEHTTDAAACVSHGWRSALGKEKARSEAGRIGRNCLYFVDQRVPSLALLCSATILRAFSANSLACGISSRALATLGSDSA